jgi:hypothetical protein
MVSDRTNARPAGRIPQDSRRVSCPGAKNTTDPRTRAALIDMAQRLYDRANRPPIDFDAIVQGFNDQNMTGSGSSEPVIQQQQQIQPNKRGDGG